MQMSHCSPDSVLTVWGGIMQIWTLMNDNEGSVSPTWITTSGASYLGAPNPITKWYFHDMSPLKSRSLAAWGTLKPESDASSHVKHTAVGMNINSSSWPASLWFHALRCCHMTGRLVNYMNKQVHGSLKRLISARCRITTWLGILAVSGLM